jgi:hypothetical protein
MMRHIFLVWLRAIGLPVAFGLVAVAAQAEDGVMVFGKVKLQGPPANSPNAPDEPYVFGQSFHRNNPQEGPLRIKANVKDAQGNTIEARIDIRGSFAEIKNKKSFPVHASRSGFVGKAFIAFEGGSKKLLCYGNNAGTITLTALGNEGQVISGTYFGVKWSTSDCQQILSSSGSFRVPRSEDY